MDDDTRPKAIDLFSGAGGTTLGLRRAGFDVRVAVDIDPYKAVTLKANHPNLKVLGADGTDGDIRHISGRQLLNEGKLEADELTLLVGCPPCQGFSLQGARSISDERNSLYLEFVRLIKETQPKITVFENVPGIVSFQAGKILDDFRLKIQAMGYEVATWILDARDFGIPQARKRLFIIGSRAGELPKKPLIKQEKISVWEAIRDLPLNTLPNVKNNSLSIAYRFPPSSEYASHLRGKKKKVMNCEMTKHSLDWLKRIHMLGWEERDENTWQIRLHPNKSAPTLTAGTRSRTACRPIHPYSDRVITVREGARISSFPDWYILPKQKAEAWSQIGNCVPPLMAQGIFDQIIKCV